MSSMTQSQILPPTFLESEDAWRSTIQTAPAFSLSARTWPNDRKGRLPTELSAKGELGMDLTKPASPKFSIQARHALVVGEELPGLGAPGPGAYGEVPPTTVCKSHPTLEMNGRGWHFGTSQRSQSTGALVVGGPGPNQYAVKHESVT